MLGTCIPYSTSLSDEPLLYNWYSQLTRCHPAVELFLDPNGDLAGETTHIYLSYIHLLCQQYLGYGVTDVRQPSGLSECGSLCLWFDRSSGGSHRQRKLYMRGHMFILQYILTVIHRIFSFSTREVRRWVSI